MSTVGYINVARKMFSADDPFWNEDRPRSRFEAWLFLIQLAQWRQHRRQTKYGLITLERGQFIASVRWLAGQLQWSPKKVFTFLAEAEKEGRIKKQSQHHAGAIYLVVNYDRYQSAAATEETDTETVPETDRKQTGNKNKQEKQEKQKSKNMNTPTGTAAPWMGEFTAAWKAANGGLPRKGAATVLAPLVAEHGIAVVVARLAPYFAQVQPQFRSVPAFAEKFGTWGVDAEPDGELPDAIGGVPNDALLRALGYVRERAA